MIEVESETERVCPLGVCDGSGLVVDEERNLSWPCECREQMIAQAVTRSANTSIPKAFRNVSFDRYPLTGVDPAIRRHVEQFIAEGPMRLREGRGLWFYGDSDDTLVSLAMLVARMLSADGASVATHSLPKLLLELRNTYSDEAVESQRNLLARLTSVDLLVLTDIGAHQQTDWGLEQLHLILNERWQDQRSVIATMALPEPDRENPERELRSAIARLRDGSPGGRELASVADRLERSLRRLEALDSRPWEDPLDLIRRRLGSRIVNRLAALCDDPILVAGPSLAPAATG